MPDASPEQRRYSEADLRRWAREGLITEAQLDTILRSEAPEAGPTDHETGEGLNAPTILYYLGGSMALVALGLFAGLNWEDTAKGWRLLFITVSMALVGGAGYYVWDRTGYVRGGGVLITIAVGMIPLLLFTIGDFFAGSERGSIFDSEMLAQASLIQLISLSIMVAVLIRSGIPMIALAVSGQAVALVATASVWWLGDDEVVAVHVILAALGGILIVGGLVDRMLRRSELGLWLSVSGHICFFYTFTYVAMDGWSAAMALVYVGTFAAFVLASAAMRHVPTLIAGVAGVYAFVFRLVADSFEGSPLLPVAIALVGISLVFLAIGYQRYRERLPVSRV